VAKIAGVDYVREARWAAQRADELMASGRLGPHDVDFVELLFGIRRAEVRMAERGCLDDGGLCDDFVAELTQRLKVCYEAMAPVEALAKDLESRFAKEAARIPPQLDQKVPTERSERNRAKRREGAARLLAVHLCQRAMYEALGCALRAMVSDQASGRAAESLMHPRLSPDARQVEATDWALTKVRKDHFSERPARPDVAPRLYRDALTVLEERLVQTSLVRSLLANQPELKGDAAFLLGLVERLTGQVEGLAESEEIDLLAEALRDEAVRSSVTAHSEVSGEGGGSLV